MEFKLSTIPINRINAQDTRFKISTGAASAALVESVKYCGLINPPILLAINDGYSIVSGFKRIEAWRQTSKSGVFARIMDPEAPLERCIQIAISDNSQQRPLNLVEQAHAVELLSSLYPEDSKLPEAAHRVGLPINPAMAEKLRKLARMDQLLKSGVLDGSIALPVAIQLHDMSDSNASRALGTLIRELGLSLNRQRELLEWVVSICRREDISPGNLLAADEIDQCRQNNDLDRRQKAQLIRDYLKRRRFPTLVSHEHRFKQTVQKLRLANGTSLIAPPHFESPTYSLKFEFKNQKELSNKLQEMEKIVKSEIMLTFWDDILG